MERHGHHQPPFCHLQQSGARRAAQAAGRTLSRRRILSVLHEQRPADFRAGRSAVMRMIPKSGSWFSDKIMRNLNLEAKMRMLLAMAGLLFATAAFAASSEADFTAALNAATAAE